ncbi:hypothetical protein MRX96_051188 [Rhipicephalus microplus]
MSDALTGTTAWMARPAACLRRAVTAAALTSTPSAAVTTPAAAPRDTSAEYQRISVSMLQPTTPWPWSRRSAVATEPRQLEVSVNDTTESRTSALTSAQAELLKCPDGSYCQSTQTCCLLVSGHYGCCPYVQAQCCSDHTSCCPEGYRCKVSTKQCVHTTSNHSVAAGQKVDPVIPKSALVSPRPNGRLIHCEDGTMCFNNQTCCLLLNGTYNCCEYPRATCCEGFDSCCPEGYACIVTLQKCKKESTGEEMPMHHSRCSVLRKAPKTMARLSITSGKNARTT